MGHVWSLEDVGAGTKPQLKVEGSSHHHLLHFFSILQLGRNAADHNPCFELDRRPKFTLSFMVRSAVDSLS